MHSRRVHCGQNNECDAKVDELFPEKYLVIDFEATCFDKDIVPREEMEIIEIGAVMVEADGFGVLDEFQSFVQPVRHPRLTPFCTKLTTIRQSDVDAAPKFEEFVANFSTWLDRFEHYTFGSWGDYDRKQLQQDCDFHQVLTPIAAPHVNLKRLFTERFHLRKRPGLGEAIKLADLQFAGTHHRGIDDARNIARLLPWIFGEKELAKTQRR